MTFPGAPVARAPKGVARRGAWLTALLTSVWSESSSRVRLDHLSRLLNAGDTPEQSW